MNFKTKFFAMMMALAMIIGVMPGAMATEYANVLNRTHEIVLAFDSSTTIAEMNPYIYPGEEAGCEADKLGYLSQGNSGNGYRVNKNTLELFSDSSSFTTTLDKSKDKRGNSRKMTWSVQGTTGTLTMQNYIVYGSIHIIGSENLTDVVIDVKGTNQWYQTEELFVDARNSYAMWGENVNLTVKGDSSSDSLCFYQDGDMMDAGYTVTVYVTGGDFAVKSAELLAYGGSNTFGGGAEGLYAPDGNVTVDEDSIVTVNTQHGNYNANTISAKEVFLLGTGNLIIKGNLTQSHVINADKVTFGYNYVKLIFNTVDGTKGTNLISVEPEFLAGEGEFVQNEKGSFEYQYTGEIPTDTPAAEWKFTFLDVPNDAWYYDDVVAACKRSLIDGKSETSFAPNDQMTYSEAIKLAACMHQLYTDGKVTLVNGSDNWYSTYMAYAVENGIIPADLSSKATQNITREEYIEIFYMSLPVSEYAEKNIIEDDKIPDVPMTNTHATAIYTLYRAGILTGSDEYGSCNPESFITRAEVATILNRMMDNGVRKTVNI